MNREDLFPPKFWKHADLEDTTFLGKIKGVTVEELTSDGKTKDKPVMYFTNSEKGLVLNMTNYNTLAEILGSDETNDWRGKMIELFAATTPFGGTLVGCIRVREPQEKTPRRTKRADDPGDDQRPF